MKWWDDIRTLRSVTFLSLLDWCDIRTQDSSVQSEESTDLQIFIWKTYFAINHLFWQSKCGQVDFNYKEDGKCIGYNMQLKILIFCCSLVNSLKDKFQLVILLYYRHFIFMKIYWPSKQSYFQSFYLLMVIQQEKNWH